MDISSWLQDTIIVKAMTGTDKTGQPVYGGPAYAVKCRIEEKYQKVVTSDGQETTSDHQIASLNNVGLQDRIWLPGTDTTNDDQARMPLSKQFAKNKSGYGFYILYL